MKTLISPGYNYIFNPKTGDFIRWGKTIDDDPDFSPVGPEIADIEVTTSCSGPAGKVCKFCYKANTPNGKNMSFETFKQVFDKLPKSLTQIAFGADATLTANPELWDMMEYCRQNDVVPNVTVANVDDETADKLASLCGAVAVSRYDDENLCYDSVERLTSKGMDQVNIHQLLSEETFYNTRETLFDFSSDPRLSKLNAIVFLSLKQKGRGTGYTRLDDDCFKIIVQTAMQHNIPFGFDSCSANKFIKVIQGWKQYDELLQMTEPCESTCFSLYINVDGEYFPCSFAEHKTFDAGNWEQGIIVPEIDNFKDLWYHDKTVEFRNALLHNLDDYGVRSCPLYEI